MLFLRHLTDDSVFRCAHWISCFDIGRPMPDDSGMEYGTEQYGEFGAARAFFEGLDDG